MHNRCIHIGELLKHLSVFQPALSPSTIWLRMGTNRYRASFITLLSPMQPCLLPLLSPIQPCTLDNPRLILSEEVRLVCLFSLENPCPLSFEARLVLPLSPANLRLVPSEASFAISPLQLLSTISTSESELEKRYTSKEMKSQISVSCRTH